jgi:hypothetical protein
MKRLFLRTDQTSREKIRPKVNTGGWIRMKNRDDHNMYDIEVLQTNAHSWNAMNTILIDDYGRMGIFRRLPYDLFSFGRAASNFLTAL